MHFTRHLMQIFVNNISLLFTAIYEENHSYLLDRICLYMVITQHIGRLLVPIYGHTRGAVPRVRDCRRRRIDKVGNSQPEYLQDITRAVEIGDAARPSK
jgi:hypothetical protein